MPRLINAPLEICFDVFNNDEMILREFEMLSESDDDPVGQWLKLAKARGETSDSDQVLLTLIVELHRKVDMLSDYIKNEQTKYISLTCKEQINSIGYENFLLNQNALQIGCEYYGRILMPVFPKRQVPIFFKAQSENLAKITKLHQRDLKDWNAYVAARERVMIRQMRGQNES